MNASVSEAKMGRIKESGKELVRRVDGCPWVTRISEISVCKLYQRPCFFVEPRMCDRCEEIKHGSKSDI
jgi:hypothetical protein